MNDIIIIGGGLGGLFTGAILSKEGFHVTVLEKNQKIGGGLQTFYRHGVGFESGMHLLGGIRKGGSIYKLCSWLGIMDQLDIRDVDHDCMDQITYLSDGMTYRIPEGKDNFIKYFQRLFPHESSNIQAYVDKLYDIVDEIDFFYLRTGNSHIFNHCEEFMWPADKLVSHYIKDPKLQDVLAYMNPMFGGVAGHTPAYIHALINVLYINGPSRFAGNSQQMAEALRILIERGGGKVIGGDKVVKIDIDDRLITGVQTASGKMYKGDRYICAIHPAQMLKMTDSKVFTKAFRDRINHAPQSYSCFCVYVIFKPQAFPFINHTCYFQDDYGMVWHYNEYDHDAFPRGFLYMTPSEKEQGMWATKMIINSIMPYSACEKWADTTTGHRGNEYEDWKKEHIEKVLGKMERLYPGFHDKCDYVFASSPLTIRDYFDEPQGSLYGVFHDVENIAESQVSIFTKFKNLLMTGQNINLHGFCGVPLTAINTAEAIVGNDKITKEINEFTADDK